jgi:branched-chain amino acid transport system ATP-binding protein
MAAILTVSSLSKAFGALRVTDRISFDVQDGEVLGIIGPNGAGKTTLFALLAGNIAPSGGRIVFRGTDITDLPVHARTRAGLARTFQVPRPFTHMTVRDNLLVACRFGGRLGAAEATSWTRQVLAQTGLAQVADTLAGRLPLLLRKRHELARALATRPALLLVDEVAAGLTDQEVEDFIALIADIRRSGVTVVWIEHVMRTMLAATDRLLALHAGQIIALGATRAVLASPDVRRIYLGE